VTLPASEKLVEYVARRLELTVEAPYADLQRRLDEAAPELGPDDTAGLESGREAWGDFVRGLAWTSPSGFVRLWRHEPDAVLRHSGSTIASTTYLLADLAATARALRQDPAALLYLPVRLELQSRGAQCVLLLEQPGPALAGFERNKLTQAGAELDRRLGDLLESIDLPRPSALRD
jgi:hypothetical protein